MEKTSGIYCILNHKNNKLYIGSSINLKNRWYDHKKTLKKNKHHSSKLQNSWNKHGGEYFHFYVIEYCDVGNLITKEQKWLDMTLCYIDTYGYNVLSKAYSQLGYKHTEETKQKMKDNHWDVSGGNHPLYGVGHTEETKKKISVSKKGYKHTEETKKKMSESHVGMVHTEETKQKLKSLNSGENNPATKLTNEDIIKIRELYQTKIYTQKQLGMLFNINFRTVSQIINYKRWKNI